MPAARDSPADAAICTILFSRILLDLKSYNIAIEITAAGMLAETVIPANNPRYALAEANIMERMTPRKIAFTVVSGNRTEAGILGLESVSILLDFEKNYVLTSGFTG